MLEEELLEKLLEEELLELDELLDKLLELEAKLLDELELGGGGGSGGGIYTHLSKIKNRLKVRISRLIF